MEWEGLIQVTQCMLEIVLWHCTPGDDRPAQETDVFITYYLGIFQKLLKLRH